MSIMGKAGACFAAVVLSLSLCPRSGEALAAGEAGRLLITGSSTMCPLISEIGRRFQSMHPEVQIEVQCGGSGRGISDVREGKAAIGMASRPLADKERDLYGFTMARDGLSIIVHKDNPVESLSNRRVADIYTGRISNWNKVGGRNAAITVINPPKGYSSADFFTQYFKVDYDQIDADIVAGDNSQRLGVFADNPNAIAYMSSGEAERRAQSGVPIKLLPVNKVIPSRRNIITGNYPITRPLNLVTKGLPSGMVKAFIDYCLSSAVVDLIERFDFVPYED